MRTTRNSTGKATMAAPPRRRTFRRAELPEIRLLPGHLFGRPRCRFAPRHEQGPPYLEAGEGQLGRDGRLERGAGAVLQGPENVRLCAAGLAGIRRRHRHCQGRLVGKIPGVPQSCAGKYGRIAAGYGSSLYCETPPESFHVICLHALRSSIAWPEFRNAR